MNIDFKKDKFRFTTRASAIIYNKDKTKILLFKVEDGRDFFMLPGGRIEFDEDSLSAVKREIKEEIGFDIDFEFCSIRENFAIKDEFKVTQYDFCYKGIYKENIKKEKFICNDNDYQTFYWVNVSEINNYKLFPKSTYKLIKSDKVEHFIER